MKRSLIRKLTLCSSKPTNFYCCLFLSANMVKLHNLESQHCKDLKQWETRLADEQTVWTTKLNMEKMNKEQEMATQNLLKVEIDKLKLDLEVHDLFAS